MSNRQYAKQTISKMEASRENFKSAWKALENRYENKSLIFQSHINEIISMSPIASESASGLRDISDRVSSHYRAILNLGSKDELCDNVLICLMLSKLDATTIIKWEESTTTQISVWEDFKNFLEKRASTLEKLEWSLRQCQNSVAPSQVSRTSTKTKNMHSSMAISENPSCAMCNSAEHSLQNCTIESFWH